MQFSFLLQFFLLLCPLLAYSAEPDSEGHTVNFEKVSMKELIRFVSRIAEVNFIADDKLLDFEVTFVANKPSSSQELLKAICDLLDEYDLEAVEKESYFIIKPKPAQPPAEEKKESIVEVATATTPLPTLIPVIPEPEVIVETPPKEEKLAKVGKFTVYKLRYHPGGEILGAIKQIATDLVATGVGDESLLIGIRSMQWMQSSNSLFFSAEEHVIDKILELIETLDTPLKQVLIEVLVVETNMQNSTEFGLQLSAGSKYKKSLGGGFGSYPPSDRVPPFADSMKEISADHTPTGTPDIPLGKGFDLGIIGDIISHKGQSYFSLGALLSALQVDGKFSIVLNQKIITQENKPSKIFVGNNIPFAGSIVQTVGSGQQTTSNIEYKDIGVSLNLTPMISEGDMITMEIQEEITETLDHLIEKGSQLSGIKTSKANMLTNVHVPDRHFLILSGMTRSKKSNSVAGPPCLGGIPLIGSFFNNKSKVEDKSSILIFVRPRIIHSEADHEEITDNIDLRVSGNSVSLDKLSQEGHLGR